MDEDEDSEEKDGHGLDKDRRLAERREKRAEEEKSEPLDPPFPYGVMSFDPLMVMR